MKINGGSNKPIRPDATREERSPAADKTKPNGAAATRLDTVEISDAGRARVAETGETTAAHGSRQARLQAIRERILQGAYDTDEVVGEVARRIIERGDLQPASPPDVQ